MTYHYHSLSSLLCNRVGGDCRLMLAIAFLRSIYNVIARLAALHHKFDSLYRRLQPASIIIFRPSISSVIDAIYGDDLMK